MVANAGFIPCKRTGKGSQVAIQRPCTTTATTGTNTGETEELLEAVIENDNAAWLEIPCVFSIQPPGNSFDNITGEQCLNEEGNPTTDLGDLQADNPSVTVPFCKDDPAYQALVEASTCGECLLICYRYGKNAEGGQDLFFAKIQDFTPEEIQRTEFMRTSITFLRTSPVWSTMADLEDATTAADGTVAFDCGACRPVGAEATPPQHIAS